MAITDLMPWTWGKKHLPLSRKEDEHPIALLHRDLNRIFEDFYRTFEMEEYGKFPGYLQDITPTIDMTETDKDIKITAELPGMDEKDVEVTLSRDMVTIRGEKKEEEEEDLKGHYRMERRYGMFTRNLPLPCEIDSDRASAAFKKGVLYLTLPKNLDAQKNVKTIPINKA